MVKSGFIRWGIGRINGDRFYEQEDFPVGQLKGGDVI